MAVPPGLTLLRLAPLLASTAAVTNTCCEDIYLRPMTTPRPHLRPQANRLVRDQVKAFHPTSAALVVTIYSLGFGTAVANALRLRRTGSGSNQPLPVWLYAGSAAFTLFHFVFGPRDLVHIGNASDESNVDAGKEKDNCSAMAAWIRLNVVRGLTAEFPALVLSFLGFMSETV